MPAHTKRSPSGAKRFLACPGTLALVATLPEEQQNTGGVAAEIGTVVHDLIHRSLESGCEPSEFRDRISELIGDDDAVSMLKPNAKTPGPNRRFYIIDDDMIEGATVMTDYVRQRLNELGLDASALQLETRTNPLPDRDDASGTADVTIDGWPVLLEVADYKNGYNVVDANDNEQLLAYLLGKALEQDFAHENYRVTVVQPHAPHEDGRIRSVDATKAELLAFQKKLRAGIKKCERAEKELDSIVGDDPTDLIEWNKEYLHAGEHCMFCPAQAICPERKRYAQQLAKIDFDDEPSPISYELQNEQVSRILRWAPNIEAMIKAANVYAQRAMESGQTIPGFKLVRGRSNRRVKNNYEQPIDFIAGLRGIGWEGDEDDLWCKPELKSAAQVEKLLPKGMRKKYNEVMLEKPPGKLTVAPAEDERPAVLVHAGDDFIEDAEFEEIEDGTDFEDGV